MIRFVCSQCRRPTQAPIGTEGRFARCPSCQFVYIIPPPVPPPAESTSPPVHAEYTIPPVTVEYTPPRPTVGPRPADRDEFDDPDERNDQAERRLRRNRERAARRKLLTKFGLVLVTVVAAAAGIALAWDKIRRADEAAVQVAYAELEARLKERGVTVRTERDGATTTAVLVEPATGQRVVAERAADAEAARATGPAPGRPVFVWGRFVFSPRGAGDTPLYDRVRAALR